LANAQKELDSLLEEFGYLERDYCSPEANRENNRKRKAGQLLEEGLIRDINGEFYRRKRSSLSEDDFNLYLRLKTVHLFSGIRAAAIACAVALFLIFFWLLYHM
jgi:hypothetical protein